MEANAAPGENRVAVPVGTYTLTIAGMDEDGAATGDLDITDDLVLAGAGATATIVQACAPSPGPSCWAVDRVFDVDPASQGIAVALSGVTVQRGVAWRPAYPRPEAGGGILNHGELNIIGSIVAHNIGSLGAGISSEGNLTISYSTVAKNPAGGWDSTAGGIYSNGTATIDHAIITNNSAEQLGGILVRGTTSISNSVVVGNSSTGVLYPGAAGISADGSLTVSKTAVSGNYGGGINWHGFLQVTDSSITGNTDREGIFNWFKAPETEDVAVVERTTISGHALAVAIEPGTHLTLKQTTISNNGGGITSKGSLTTVDSIFSENGVGVVNNGGTADLTNVTVSGNTTPLEGGGLRNLGNGSVTVVNSTIANNTGSQTGGIYNEAGGSVTVQNTIVAGNNGTDCSGVLVSQGHNISNDGSCGLAGPGDMPSTDPLLGPLGDNGGPTRTHALLAGSPAINAGDNSACPLTDQRGAARPLQGTCDIGSYEFGLLKGDVNCAGDVDAVDALAILRAVAQLPVTAQCVDLSGDVNCDGAETAVDALLVLRHVAALPVNQKEPCPNIGTPF